MPVIHSLFANFNPVLKYDQVAPPASTSLLNKGATFSGINELPPAVRRAWSCSLVNRHDTFDTREQSAAADKRGERRRCVSSIAQAWRFVCALQFLN